MSRPSPVGERRPLGVPVAAIRAATAAYAALLAVITLLPIRWGAGLARWPNNWEPQLVPVRSIVVNVANGDRLSTLAAAAGNLALFVPLGFLLPLLLARFDRFWRTVAAGAALSLLIELAQLLFFPGVRRADVNDLLLNTLGTALGWLAHRLAARVRNGRAPAGV